MAFCCTFKILHHAFSRCDMYITCLSQMCQHQLTCFVVDACCCIFYTHATCSYLLTHLWRAVAVEMVEAETDDFPAKHFMVPKNKNGQLCVDSIKEYLAGSGQILVSICGGYPACKDGWTMNTYSAIPIQLHVALKPGTWSVAKCSSIHCPASRRSRAAASCF